VPNDIAYMTMLEFNNNFAQFKADHQIELSQFSTKAFKPDTMKLHKSIDGSLNLMINELNLTIQTDGIQDIRYYVDAVHTGFKVFEKYPVLLELYKSEVVDVFSRFESKKWSECIVDNMWESYQKSLEV
jgi:hypothetical protein